MEHHPNYSHTTGGNSSSAASWLNNVYENTRSWHVMQDFLDSEKQSQNVWFEATHPLEGEAGLNVVLFS